MDFKNGANKAIEEAMIKDRYLHSSITADLLGQKMVFIGGPRQVGKTTLAQVVGKHDYPHYAYLNWDSREDRKTILDGRYKGNAQLVIFDEIHKYKKWKNFVKGEFDKYRNTFAIIVTGSSRLDVYRKGGDSLMGRYHCYRLHPFSLAEVSGFIQKGNNPGGELHFAECGEKVRQYYDALFTYGGFPEPFLARDMKVLRRFHNERVDRLVKEDIRDLENIRDLSALQILVELLPGKVGSLFSLNSLKEDLQVTHKSVSHWVDILERFYYHFRIYPYNAKLIKSLRKGPKLYLWDWSQVNDEAARLENIVASHLLKFIHYLFDTEGYRCELFFLRDIERKEVDFLVTFDKKPWFAVEVKKSDSALSKELRYFAKKLDIPYAFQIVGSEHIDHYKEGIRIMSVEKFLAALV